MAERVYYRTEPTKFQRGYRAGDLIDSYGRIVNEADLYEESYTPFGEVVNVVKTPIINLQPHHGLSIQRDYIEEDGVYASVNLSSSTGGRVTNQNGKHKVMIDGPNQSTKFESAQTGVYISGYLAEAGIGVLFNQKDVPTGLKIYWGYLNDDDGLGFYKDSTGLYICIKSGGVQTLIGQNPNQEKDNTEEKLGWNHDRMDGSGKFHNASGLSVDVTRGRMFQLRFFHYGFGNVSFYINSLDKNGVERKILLHKYQRQGDILIQNPNLPISVQLFTDETYSAGEYFVEVGGRQVSVLGSYVPLFRYSHMYHNSVSVDNTGWKHIVSGKLDGSQRGIQTFLDSVSIGTTEPIRWGVFLNANPTGGDFLPPINTTDNTSEANETAMLFNADPVATVSGGHMLIGDIKAGGEKKAIPFQSVDSALLPIPRDRPVSLCAIATTTTPSVVDGSLRIRQEY